MKNKLFSTLFASVILTVSAYSQTTTPLPYCAAKIASMTTIFDNHIKVVSIGTLNNNSGPSYFNGSEYAYYNNIAAVNLQKGTSVPATFTVSRSDGEMNAFWVFIDYNSNSAFEQSELVGQAPLSQFTVASSFGSNVNINFAVNIPASAQTGQTRMRIIYTNTDFLTPAMTPTACNSDVDLFSGNPFNYGEIEDYDVNITGAQTVAAPVADFTKVNIACKNQNIALTDNSTNAPTAWSWTITGATPSVSTLQNPTVKYAGAGTYTILFSAANAGGTSATIAKTVTISACTGIENIASSENDQISIYPNPGNGYFNLACGQAIKMLVYDVSGKKILEQSLDAGKHQVDLYDQPNGIYFMVIDNNGIHQGFKLIKQ